MLSANDKNLGLPNGLVWVPFRLKRLDCCIMDLTPWLSILPMPHSQSLVPSDVVVMGWAYLDPEWASAKKSCWQFYRFCVPHIPGLTSKYHQGRHAVKQGSPDPAFRENKGENRTCHWELSSSSCPPLLSPWLCPALSHQTEIQFLSFPKGFS